MIIERYHTSNSHKYLYIYFKTYISELQRLLNYLQMSTHAISMLAVCFKNGLTFRVLSTVAFLEAVQFISLEQSVTRSHVRKALSLLYLVASQALCVDLTQNLLGYIFEIKYQIQIFLINVNNSYCLLQLTGNHYVAPDTLPVSSSDNLIFQIKTHLYLC